MFKIKTVPTCPKRILQSFQVDEDLGIDVTGRFEVKTKDKTFSTSIYPFLQSDHLLDQLKGKPENQMTNKGFLWRLELCHMLFRPSKARQNFDETSKHTFTYEDFSYNVVKVFFEQLHHATTNEISLIDALELMVFCNHEGQLDMKSDFETRLYQDLTDQILTKMKNPKELCCIWLYLRSRGPSGRD